MKLEEAIFFALQKHPDCKYTDWENGLAPITFALTYVIKLWRNEECYLANDPPKYICSYENN